MGETRDFLERQLRDGNLEFALEAPIGVVKQKGPGGNVRPTDPPVQQITENRLIADTDPHVGEGVQTLVDYLVGSGFVIKPKNIPFTDEEQTHQDIAELKRLIESSNFEEVLQLWVWHALVDGTGYIEIVWEDEVFSPRLLPSEKIKILTDEFGRVTGYEMEVPGDDPVEYGPYDVAHLKFHYHPGEDYGRSLIERFGEQADMLRDMEIDMARFVATKAYPPVLWKLGTDDRHYTPTQIDEWLDTVEAIEPDSMLAVGHDVDFDVVGTTSTSSQGGVLNLEGTFTHLLGRMSAGLGVPMHLMLDTEGSQNQALSTMPKFDRRIKRYQRIIKTTVEQVVFRSIMGHPTPEDYQEVLPEFEFGEHSSDEERLETQEALDLFFAGFLTREAFATRVGIDPEVEMPTEEQLRSEIVPVIQDLQGAGDNVMNPDGGHPTNNGTGGEDSSRAAKTRQNPERQSDDSRPKRDVHNE
ncbi:phage portal protein family protein [Halorubellus litoreus]|uniref:Phage portal protein, SPP1 Gp6-like n=1 Tax=Halorubellus litoreus TaxID=755308 RepID=A0ABD5VE31_9EURY